MSWYESDRTREGKSFPDAGLTRLESKLLSQRNSSAVNLADSFVGDDGCELIVRLLRENYNISSLDLRGNGITAAGLAVLSVGLTGRSSLKSLSLEWNNIGDDIGVFSEALSKNLNLQVLDLRNNRIGPDGAAMLARVFELNTVIQKVDLRWNEIGVNGGRKILTALSKPHSLKQLDLAGNKIPDDLLQAIEKALKGEELASRPVTPKKEFTYNDELFSKYEALMIHNARCEAKIKELEILLEQEARKVSEVRYELGRDLENERSRRAAAEESFLKFKEESLKREVEDSRALQEMENKISKLVSEKNVLSIELESVQSQFEGFSQQSKEHIQSLQEKIDIQDRQYRVLEESNRNTLEEIRFQNDEERYELSKEYERKISLADEHINHQKGQLSGLENENKALRNQILQIKTQAANDLNDLELNIREEESLKYDNMAKNYEERVRSLEQSRESMNKKNQDLYATSKQSDKKLTEQISQRDSEISSLKSENFDLNKQVQKSLNTIENLRSELNSYRVENDKIRQENDDLNRCIKERKEVFISQIDQISQETTREKTLLQDKIEELLSSLQKTEIELGKVRRDKERIIKDHEFLNETLKMKVSNFIQDTVFAHMRKVEEE